MRPVDAAAAMTEPHDVEIRLTSDPGSCCIVRAAVGAAAGRVGFDDATVGQIMLAVDEAFTNIIRHGYDGRTDQPVWIGFTTTVHNHRPALRITLEDRARQVDPATICGRNLDDLRPGGLGVHLIRRVMDSVIYAPGPCGGMTLCLVKSLPATPSNQDPGP